jgi:hypothetical protein
MTAQDSLTTFFFFAIDTTLLSYFLYLAFYTYCKLYNARLKDSLEHTFEQINQYLNLFLTFFKWVLFTPLCEINSGMMVR